MKIIAFLQLRNELENGNLTRCLKNCQQWSNAICIYDDCSTDGSQEEYLKYTEKDNIIFGTIREFNRELYNKQSLLVVAKKHSPDWIVWIDGDDILDNDLTSNMSTRLEELQSQGFGAGSLHNMNLWRHPAYYRLDNSFNDLWKVNLWKNLPEIHYAPSTGLHQPQHPRGLGRVKRMNNRLLHYGFASARSIGRKYLMYKSLGQKGWDLERLIDEQSSFVLEKVPINLFPKENIPSNYDIVEKPSPITYNAIREFNSLEEVPNDAFWETIK